MKKRRICIGVFICCALIIAAGVRTDTGQGYTDPVVLPPEAPRGVVGLQRTLEVRLTNRQTGRSQQHRWSLAVPEGGAVEIECHEWVLIGVYGFSVPGFPKNPFRRVIPLDRSEEGRSGPYDFVIRWHPKSPNQVPEPMSGLTPGHGSS